LLQEVNLPWSNQEAVVPADPEQLLRLVHW
jgi:hypothetical protein